MSSFLAYEPTFTGGVRVAVADLNADDTPDVVTAAGPGGGPRVRAFDGETGATLLDFLAYESTFIGGVWVAAGPTGDGQVGIATGADAGGGPRVRVFDADGTQLQDLFAFDSSFTGGARVALGRPDTGPAVFAAPGAGMPPTVRGFDVGTGSQVFEQAAGEPFETGGVWVAAGDLDGDGVDDLVTAVGSGSDTELRLFSGASGWGVNQATVGGAASGVAVVDWGGQPAVGVLSGTTLTMYAPWGVGESPTVLGQVDGSGWGGAGGGALTTAAAGGTVLLDADYVLSDPPGDYTGYATLHVKVTANPDEHPGRHLWEYTITNDTFAGGYGEYPLTYFNLWFNHEVVDVADWQTSTGQEGLEDGSTVEGVALLDMEVNQGESEWLSFTTPPSDIVDVAYAVGGVLQGSGVAVWAEGIPAPKVELPQIVITYADATEVTQDKGLKVAKWQDAFKLTADGQAVVIKGPDTGTNRDFIDRDPDRFHVFVYDLAKWNAKVGENWANPHIQVKISTKNAAYFEQYNDAPTAVDLVRLDAGAFGKGPGWYWSDSQMLVSNKVDDVYSAATYLGADEAGPGGDGLPKNGYTWKVSDRTHRVALGGTIKAEYPLIPGLTVKHQVPVKAKYNTKLNINVLREVAGGAAVATHDSVFADIRRAQEIFAQVGIAIPFEFVSIKTVNPPPGVDLTFPWFLGYPDIPANGMIDLTDEEKALLGDEFVKLRTDTDASGKDDIETYYVNRISDQRRGESFPEKWVPNAKYADSVIVSELTKNYRTFAHEAGHVLENRPTGLDTHYPYGQRPTTRLDSVNLMVEGGELTVAIGSVFDSRRLTTEQETQMHSGRAKLLYDPS